uniref:Uncharacterized protein n=1 Tax=Cacopsylla melanoneura TaxID=428564 RepID=A0A8D8TV20_9HEMI
MWWKKSMTWCWKIGELLFAILLRVWGFQLKGFGTFYTNLGMKKLCARWVPRLLTKDQKRQRKDIHKSATSMAKLHELRWELLPHPPYLLPATTICCLTSKNCLVERNLPPILH